MNWKNFFISASLYNFCILFFNGFFGVVFPDTLCHLYPEVFSKFGQIIVILFGCIFYKAYMTTNNSDIFYLLFIEKMLYFISGLVWIFHFKYNNVNYDDRIVNYLGVVFMWIYWIGDFLFGVGFLIYARKLKKIVELNMLYSEIVLIYISIFLTYLFSFIIYYYLDKIKYITDTYKIQKKTPDNFCTYWTNGILLSCFNLFVTIPIVILLSFYVIPVHATSVFTLKVEFIKPFLYVIISEAWFYFFHYMGHHKLFYKFHKDHHQYTAPVAINALYADPLDFAIGSAMSISIGPILFPGHIYTLIIYTIAVIFVNATSHSGYNVMSRFHDDHHKYFNYNFGYGIFMDRIFGTEKK